MSAEKLDAGSPNAPPWSHLPRDLLPASVWNCVDRATDEPFPNDTAYFECLVASEAVWKRIVSLQTTTQAAVYDASTDDFGQPNASRFTEGRLLRECLYQLALHLDQKRLETIALARIEGQSSSSGKPLVERFLDAMSVSNLEKDVFRFMLVAVSGVLREVDSQHFSLTDTGAVGFVSSKEAYQRFADVMSVSQFLTMTSRDSKWITEHVLERIDIVGDDNLSALSNSTLRILLGFSVPSEKVYAEIESPCLRELLLEYEPFTSTEVGNRILNDRARPNGSSSLGNVETEDEKESHRIDSLIDKLSSSKIDERNIYDIIGKIQEQEREAAAAGLDETGVDADIETFAADEDGKDFGPYRSELDYLEDQFRESRIYVMLTTTKERASDDNADDDEKRLDFMRSGQNGYRELSAEEWKVKNLRKAEKLEARLEKVRERIRCRLQATKKERKRLPRLEQLTEVLGLGAFDRFVILSLIKSTISPDMNEAYFGLSRGRLMVNVEHFIGSYSTLLEVNMKCRKSFYKSGPLLKEGIISLSGQDFSSDLNKSRVYIDRRFVDYVCGVDLELSELVDGSHLYTPSINIDDVILPSELKNRIVDSALNFEFLKLKYRDLKIDEKIRYGLGQIFLFYGSSGTGKTMMANAIATKLKKKVLLVNFPSLGYNEAGQTIKMLFREARIQKAILFFDECESMFRSRDLGASAINTCLSELERFDDMCILATNRANDLDEAMFRRISLAVEFKRPDHLLREKIWEKLKPEGLELADDVCFRTIARKYELAGGFIKNVWLSAIALMMGRQSSTVCQADLEKAASEQVVGSLRNDDLDRQIVPTCGIEKVVVSDDVNRNLKDIVDHKKAQSVLFNQWGFESVHRADTGVTALFHGPPGTAEAISFDLGRPLMVVNSAELVNKYVGETGKNIASAFRDAKSNGSVLVFDEGEGLFGSRSMGSSSSASSTSRHDNLNVGLLLQLIESFPGVCIVITNSAEAIDEAFFRRFNHVVSFEKPGPRLRLRLWQLIIPKQCPLSADVSTERLANQFELTGGEIKSALLRAASRAALRTKESERVLRMVDLEESCAEELSKQQGKRPRIGMYI